MAAVLTVVVMQAKLSTTLGNYADMNAGSRNALTLFERELRAASDVSTMDSNKVAVTIITTYNPATDTSTSVQVEYAYDAAGRKLYRTQSGRRTLVLSDLESFSFTYFDKNDALTSSAIAVKKILISATLRRSVMGIANSDYIVSAMVTMRNRIVTS